MPEQKTTQTPAAVPTQSVLSPTNTTPVTALSTNETADLKAKLAQAEMAAWSSSATPAEQARNLKKFQDLKDKIKKAEAKEKKATESQNQKAANVGEQPLALQTSKPTLASLCLCGSYQSARRLNKKTASPVWDWPLSFDVAL